MSAMERVSDPEPHVAWLESVEVPGGTGTVTGFDCVGWEASTWVLNTMWENPALQGLGSHDDWERREGELTGATDHPIEAILKDTVATGGSLGFVTHPGPGWQRLRWADHARELGGFRDRYAPSTFWFSHRSWPVHIEPPTEGSLDSEALASLLEALTRHLGDDPACLAYYAANAADFESTHLWRGPLSTVVSLLDPDGADYHFTPSNIWAEDRSWFVYTDCDLSATKVSGTDALIGAIKGHPDLETVDWPTATSTRARRARWRRRR